MLRNAVAVLKDKVLAVYPTCQIEVDEPLRSTGAWWIGMTFDDGRRVTVMLYNGKVTLTSNSPENLAKFGYGAFSYGDELYTSVEDAVARLLDLIRAGKYTEDPGW